MKHKHHDVLIAIAEGRDVEWYDIESNAWRVPTAFNPIENHECKWRIKPEPEAEWKQKLRQAAREGKRIEYFDARRANGAIIGWTDCLINSNPDGWDFMESDNSDYRIVPKTVTRWLWAYSTDGAWWLAPMPMTEGEANMRYPLKSVQKIEGTKTEFPE